MEKVRLAVIGIGNMGSHHCRSIATMNNAVLAAVCDIKRERADKFAAEFNCKAFYSTDDLFKAKVADAVIVAVPHYSHPDITIEAFRNGLHVLCEKPIAVTKSEGERMVAEHNKHPELQFALMFQQRTHNAHKHIRQLIQDKEFGDIMRVNWTVTTWFRTQAYYDSGDWRATWAGEGGGVLLNQCPHHLDLFQWFFGLPVMVRSYIEIGKYHDIEVEDEVSTYCRFADGSSGTFITSTAEYPGTNRLEIAGTRGRMVFEDGVLKFRRTEVPVDVFRSTTPKIFAGIPTWDIVIPNDPDTGNPHKQVIENFVASILDPKVELVAQGAEGLRAVELGNAMLYSGLENVEVNLPMDTAKFDARLAVLRENSRYCKKLKSSSEVDMSSSF